MMANPISKLYELLTPELQQLKDVLLQFDDNGQSNEMLRKMSEYIVNAGGKRLRPMLTLAIGKITSDNSEVNKKHLALAAAVELIHTATLLHDDVIDSSDTRRNLPTANSIWGDKASILAGDNMFSKAFQLMVSANSMYALQILSNASAVISEVEIWQLELLGKVDINLDEYLKLIANKTAVLFAAACNMGAIGNNCDSEISYHASEFGKNFGICYQIYDDLLDYMGEPKKLGKSAFQDISEGKVTLPLIFLISKTKKEEKILNLIGKENINEEEKIFLKKNILENDIIEMIEKYATPFHDKALFHLSKLNPKDEINKLLCGITTEMMERDF